MNDKPDWIVRGLLVVIVLLLAVNIVVSLAWQPGRYVRFSMSESLVGLLDTQTGKIYFPRYNEKPPVKVLDMVGDAKK